MSEEQVYSSIRAPSEGLRPLFALSLCLWTLKGCKQLGAATLCKIIREATSTHHDQRPIGKIIDDETCAFVRSKPSLKCAALTLVGTYLPLTA